MKKTVLITGASGGIGSVIARTLLEEGFNVYMTDVQDALMRKINREYPEISGFSRGDITNPAFCRETAFFCADLFGGIDVLINCAGVAMKKDLLEVDKEEFMRLFEINVYANLAMMQACHEYLRKSEGADIINIVSSSGVYPHVHQGVYCATKFAQKALGEVMNIELFDDDIRVHSLYPSTVETAMAKIARPDLDQGLSCRPEELADIIVFLIKNINNSVIDNLVIRRYTKRPDEM